MRSLYINTSTSQQEHDTMYLTFSQINVNQRFLFEGLYYTKINSIEATSDMGYTDNLVGEEDCFVAE